MVLHFLPLLSVLPLPRELINNASGDVWAKAVPKEKEARFEIKI